MHLVINIFVVVIIIIRQLFFDKHNTLSSKNITTILANFIYHLMIGKEKPIRNLTRTYLLYYIVYILLQDPRVTSVSPSYGPRSGGTRITLSGSQLLAGSNQQVLINNNSICTIIRCVLITSPVLDLAHVYIGPPCLCQYENN